MPCYRIPEGTTDASTHSSVTTKIKRVLNKENLPAWISCIPLEYLMCGPLAEAWLAAKSQEERAQLLPNGWPEKLFAGRTPLPAIKDVYDSISAAFKHGTIYTPPGACGYDKHYDDLGSCSNKKTFRFKLIREGCPSATIVTRSHVNSSAGALHRQPRREVWSRLVNIINTPEYDMRLALTLQWSEEILATVREVERDFRPPTDYAPPT